jgi:hypothetical protein
MHNDIVMQDLKHNARELITQRYLNAEPYKKHIWRLVPYIKGKVWAELFWEQGAEQESGDNCVMICTAQTITEAIKWGRMRWVGHVA